MHQEMLRCWGNSEEEPLGEKSKLRGIMVEPYVHVCREGNQTDGSLQREQYVQGPEGWETWFWRETGQPGLSALVGVQRVRAGCTWRSRQGWVVKSSSGKLRSSDFTLKAMGSTDKPSTGERPD